MRNSRLKYGVVDRFFYGSDATMVREKTKLEQLQTLMKEAPKETLTREQLSESALPKTETQIQAEELKKTQEENIKALSISDKNAATTYNIKINEVPVTQLTPTYGGGGGGGMFQDIQDESQQASLKKITYIPLVLVALGLLVAFRKSKQNK